LSTKNDADVARGAARICSGCGSGQEPGFLLDRSDTLRCDALWISGEPVKPSLFSFGVSVKGRTRFSVRAWRCTTCGKLELYADMPPVMGVG